jgi:phosphoribosylformylglycinamidine synthase subunit PurL
VVGAEPVGATNNLNFGNPERPEIMAQLVESIEGMAEACRFFDVPITGGNVSLYNETLGEGIWPTPVVGVVGLMKTGAPVGMHFERPGRAVMLVGGMGACDPVRFGGTQYAKAVLGDLWGLPPALDLEYEKCVQAAMREMACAGVVESAHDVSDGGLAVALAECSFGPAGVGAELEISTELAADMPPELLLFHEGPSRVLVSTEHPDRVAEIAERHGVEAPRVGVTIKEGIVIRTAGSILIQADAGKLRNIFERALEDKLRA